MKSYSFHITFPASNVAVTKKLKNDKDAKFWAQLCLDICGKDEHGRRYVTASLKNAKGEEIGFWQW